MGRQLRLIVLVASALTPEGPRFRVLHECALDGHLATSGADEPIHP